jgi:hypothetical protein
MKAKAIKTDSTSCVIIYKCDAKETPIMRLYVTQADLRALATVASALNFAFNMGPHENNKANNTRGGESGALLLYAGRPCIARMRKPTRLLHK